MTIRSFASRTGVRQILIALVAAAATPLLRAQNYDWNNALGGSWQTGTSWSPAGPPPAAATARFGLNNVYTVSLAAGVTVNSLSLNQGDVSLNLNGNSLNLPSTVNGGIANAGATGALRLNNGTVTAGNLIVGGSGGSNGTFVLDVLTTATVGGGAFYVGTSGTGTVSIQNSSTLLTTGSAGLGLSATGTGTATLNGSGASWTVQNVTLKIGSYGNGTVNVTNGASMSVPAVEIGEISGSTGKLTLSGNGSVFTSAGTVNVGGVSAGFPAVSATVNIGGAATANFNGVTNLRTTATVNLSGGTLNLNTLNITPGAVVNWTGGKVQFANGASITGGVLDTFLAGTHSLGFGRTLAAAAGTMQLDTGLTLDGGTLAVPVLTVNAPLVIGAFGTVNSTDTITLNAGKSLTIEEFGTLASTNPIFNIGGIIEPKGLLAGISAFVQNIGTVQGTGRFAGGMNIGIGGTVRARDGDYLIIDQIGSTSSGHIELSGGTIEYSRTLSNLGNGVISGRGEFRGNTANVPFGWALSNLGLVALSAGITDIRGAVLNGGTGRIIVSGGAVVTFFDDLKNNGAEFKISAGSGVVCFGVVSGTGAITGSGTIFMEGGYSPGASPASISIAPQTVFTDTNTLTMELGGTAPGAQHDKLSFSSAATVQVTWGGTLEVKLINGFEPAAWQSFDLFDFDSSRSAGTFDAIALPPLPGGLVWDASTVYTTGIISVIPEQINYPKWAEKVLEDPGARPWFDHDRDGLDNATEFALGLYPAQPGTTDPAGGLHHYPDGERLRVLFTRPLDRTGVTLIVQASDDLTNWTDVATSVNSLPFTGPGFVAEDRAHPPGEPGLVEVRDILPIGAATRRQMRVLVTLTP